jgi:hypothetical protein
MNALVNSQLQALEKLKDGYERRMGRRFPIPFAKYTGETDEAVRDTLRLHPPQILLTNYVIRRTRTARTPFPLGRQRSAEGNRSRPPPALPGLLADDGTGRGHRRLGLGPFAQRSRV